MADDHHIEPNGSTSSSTMNDPPAPASAYAKYDSKTGKYVTKQDVPGGSRNAPNHGQDNRNQAEIQRLQKQSEQIASLAVMSGMIVLATLVSMLVGNAGIADLFGGSGHQGGPRSVGSLWQEGGHPSGRAMQSTQLSVAADLVDMYHQRTVNVTFPRHEVCDECHGAGGHGVSACPVCGGHGVTTQVVRSPFGLQQIQQRCHRCGGSGRHMDHTCDKCHGRGIHQQQVTKAVKLSAGLIAGDIIRLPFEGDQNPNVGSGDVLIQVHMTGTGSFPTGLPDRSTIRRRNPSQPGEPHRNDDLEVEIYVSFKEAMLGFKKVLQHPSGRKVTVSSITPVSPGHVIVLPGQGMPRRTSSAMARQKIADDGRIIEMQKPGLVDDDSSAGGAGLLGRVNSVPVLGPAVRWLLRLSGAAAADGLDQASSHGSGSHGDLHVRIAVKLPASLSSQQQEAVSRAFSV